MEVESNPRAQYANKMKNIYDKLLGHTNTVSYKRIIKTGINFNGGLAHEYDTHEHEKPLCTFINPQELTYSDKSFFIVNLYAVPGIGDIDLSTIIPMKYLQFCIYQHNETDRRKRLNTGRGTPETFLERVYHINFFECFPYLRKIYDDLWLTPDFKDAVDNFAMDVLEKRFLKSYGWDRSTLNNTSTSKALMDASTRSPVAFFIMHYIIWNYFTRKSMLLDELDENISADYLRSLETEMFNTLNVDADKLNLQSYFVNGPWTVESIPDRLHNALQYFTDEVHASVRDSPYMGRYIELIPYFTLHNVQFDYEGFITWLHNDVPHKHELYEHTLSVLNQNRAIDVLVLLRFYEMILTNVIPNVHILNTTNIQSKTEFKRVYNWMLNIVNVYDILELPFWEGNDIDSILYHRKAEYWTPGRWFYPLKPNEIVLGIHRVLDFTKYQEDGSNMRNAYISHIKEHLGHNIDDIDAIAAIIYEYCDDLSNITDIPIPFIKRSVDAQRLSNFRVNTFMYDILELPEVKEIIDTWDEDSALYKLNINFLKNLHKDFT